MPMTGSTLPGGVTFRKTFGLISSASTDGTALSLTIAHGFGTALVPNATVGSVQIVVDIQPILAAGATSGWFFVSSDATNIIVGRDATSPGASASVSARANVNFIQAFVD